MFIPKYEKMSDKNTVHDFISEFGFGVIVSKSLTATHLPFVLRKDESEQGVLYAHIAKANRQWKELDGEEVLVIFSGPHSYISPTWYEKSPGVPTWNYAAVHAHGKVSLLTEQQTLEVVEEVVHKYEPELLLERDVITDEYRDKLLSAVVAFKVELSSIEGKLKLGQQRKTEDQLGVFNALNNSEDLGAQSLAQYMQKLSLGTGV